MLRLSFTMFLLLSFSYIYAQSGVYKTYADFQNGNLIQYSNKGMEVYSTWGMTFLVFFNEKGKRVRYRLGKDKIWGYQYFDRIYRIDEKNDPYLLIDLGDFIIYASSETFKFKNGDEWVYNIRKGYPMKISIGANGKMENLTKKTLARLLQGEPESIEALTKVKSKPEALFEFLLYERESHTNVQIMLD